jgi:hypothetical protein
MCCRTECKESAKCHEPKHHFDECVERVTKAQEEGSGAKEDCVEECMLTKPPPTTPSLPQAYELPRVTTQRDACLGPAQICDSFADPCTT